MATYDLTCLDAEHLSGIPASTWRRWISEGRLLAIHRNGRLWVDATDAMRLATRRKDRMRLPRVA